MLTLQNFRKSLSFLVNGTLTAEFAKLLDLEATRSIFFLFGACIIPVFAFRAFQNNDFSHFQSPYFNIQSFFDMISVFVAKVMLFSLHSKFSGEIVDNDYS